MELPARSAQVSSQVWRGQAVISPVSCPTRQASAGKWLAMLKQIAPRLARVALVDSPGSMLYISVAEASTYSLAIHGVPGRVENAADIGHAIGSFAGVIERRSDANVYSHDPLPSRSHHRARDPIPVASGVPICEWVSYGGLMSYGSDRVDTYRQAASYVDRILRGAKGADFQCRRRSSTRCYSQPQDSKSTRLDSAARAPSRRRRTDRVTAAASSSRCLAAWRPHGRSRRARNSRRHE